MRSVPEILNNISPVTVGAQPQGQQIAFYNDPQFYWTLALFGAGVSATAFGLRLVFGKEENPSRWLGVLGGVTLGATAATSMYTGAKTLSNILGKIRFISDNTGIFKTDDISVPWYYDPKTYWYTSITGFALAVMSRVLHLSGAEKTSNFISKNALSLFVISVLMFAVTNVRVDLRSYKVI